ncbi:MAG: glycosyltransferase [Rhodoferax sp.]|nr:glycosyltransferase [Rhodoferax sp.]
MEVYLADLIAAQHATGMQAFALVHGQPLPEDPPWLWRVPVQAQLVYAPIALGYRRALRRAIAHFEPDVLHLHMPNNSVFWALTLGMARDIPWVVHWHSDVVVSQIRSALALAYYAYRPFEQAVLAQARRIVATSPAYLQASEPLSHWRHKCAVVPLGLAPPVLVDKDAATHAAWEPGRLRLLSIGRLAYYKGFETLITSASKLPGVQLLIAGDGELRAPLQALIDRQPGTAARVQLLGAVSEQEKHALLASCDVFCLASRERTEAFGMVLLEAMAHGKPCLVSDLAGSGMAWLVRQAGAGRTCAPQDIAAWQAGMLWMQAHDNERRALGLAGQQAFHSRFTAAASARGLEREYRLARRMSPQPRADNAPLIVIPARNESATIGELLRCLHAAGYHHVLVIDDLSDDGTGDIARAAGARVLRPVLGLGAWGGMQTGIRYGLRRGFDCVVTMDADGQHEVSELPALLQASSQADVVVGAFPERASSLRRIAWGWFRLLTGLALTDLTSGFRCYRGEALGVLASSEATLLDYQDVGTLLLLRRAQLHVVEVPVKMNPRIAGSSRIFNSWISVGRYMAVTTLLCLSRWRVRVRLREWLRR